VIEVEAKYRSPGNDKVEKTLNRLGAKKVFSGTMEDIYFTHPGRDFRKTDEALRLRKMEGWAELTYKGPRMPSATGKSREEITLKTDDPLAAQRIVERLGFEEGFTVTKRRDSYVLDKLRIELDSVDGLGEFVELEMLTESVERTQTLLESAKEELGLDRPEPLTYLELLIKEAGASKDR